MQPKIYVEKTPWDPARYSTDFWEGSPHRKGGPVITPPEKLTAGGPQNDGYLPLKMAIFGILLGFLGVTMGWKR